MSSNPQPFSSLRLTAPASGFFGRLITIAAGTLLLVAALMFSLLALTVLLTAGLLVFAYLKWKTRHLRRHLDEQPREQAQPAPSGCVIDGEIIGDAEYEARTSTGNSPTSVLRAPDNRRSRPRVEP
ncbi:MAG: hypothetical protein ABTS16_14680 [Candidatus Accumulibacter phosphatis]|jgi:hypothetical protein|uniref:Uncharacterized protein n=1 Tax=Candidatus Accumulibacter contiguus TaxID=2954381 RepID=A0ABX1T7U4_9PROT|nr:hypothetical protein [Candidatus Accumulibacter contiguus]NMQ04892.1 hypothetical protein [Candidatus Accumulibacter contiguus]